MKNTSGFRYILVAAKIVVRLACCLDKTQEFDSQPDSNLLGGSASFFQYFTTF